MPHDPHLAELMRTALRGCAGIVEKKMFGGYCWMLYGNMLCGVEVGRFMVSSGQGAGGTGACKEGASRMDITGRPMSGFVWVKEDVAQGRVLDEWIDLAAQFVSTLRRK